MLSIEEERIDQLTEALHLLLNGKQALPVELPSQHPDDEIRQLTGYVNRLIVEYDSLVTSMFAMSRGELFTDPPKGGLKLIPAFKTLQSNLRHLTWVTQQIASGNFGHKVDFMGEFSNAFNKMTQDLKNAFEQIDEQNSKLEDINRQIMESIQYARSIQQALLPPPGVIETCVEDHFVIWYPRDVIGGDFYWFAGTAERFLVAVMDCTGHGVPGAILTMIAATTINRVFSERGCENPARLLAVMNQMVKATLKRREKGPLYDDGLDLAICRVDRKTRALDFAGAGLSLFAVTDGTVEEIKGERRSIGYRSSDATSPFRSHHLDIESPACFYLMTDGIPHQPDGEHRLPFGKKRFAQFIAENHAKPFTRQRDLFWELFSQYRGNASQRDDITLVGFRV
jgi:phosphoserine phosphatase RsbU/P